MEIVLGIIVTYLVIAVIMFTKLYREWPLVREPVTNYFIALVSLFWPVTLIVYYFSEK